MDSGRTANSKRNILYGTLQVIASQAFPFIIRTILIYSFGPEYLGLGSLFQSVLSVLSLMELGFGTAVVFSLYKPVADGDENLVCAYLAYYQRIYRRIGIAILAAGLLLIPFLKGLVHDPVLPGGLNLYACYLIYLLNAVLSYLLYGYLAVVPTAYQRQDLLSKIGIVMAVLKCAVQAAILLVSRNFYVFLLAHPMLTVVHNLVNAAMVRKYYPGIECRGEISEEQKKILNKKVSGLLINKLTNVSRNSIDSLCISAFIGLSMTGLYNNYYFIMAGMHGCTTIICKSMLASVGNSISTESPEKNYADMRLFDFMYMAIAGWVTVCMVNAYQPFITAWAGDGMRLNMPVAIGMSLYFYILDSGAICWVYHEGAGLWWEDRFIMIGEAVANVVLNIVLCKWLGVLGIILATVVSVFMTNLILLPRMIFREYFRNGKLIEFWKDHAGYTLTMALSAGMSWVACEKLLPMGIMEGAAGSVLCIAGRILVCSAVFGVTFFLLWRRSERFGTAAEWVKRIRKT